MFLLHASPFRARASGTELRARDLVRALALPRVVLAYPEGRRIKLVEVMGGDVAHPILFDFTLDAPAETVGIESPAVLKQVRRAIKLFGVVGCILPSEAAREVVASQLAIPLECTSSIEIGPDGPPGRWREFYEKVSVIQPGHGIPGPEVLQEVFEHRDVSTDIRWKPNTFGPRVAAPKYQASWWYPAFLKIKPLIPKAVRTFGRSALVRLEKTRSK